MYVLINTGQIIFIAGAVGVIHIGLKLLSIARVPEVSKFCHKQARSFKFSAYLRLVLLVYLDLAVASLIQVTQVSLS